MKLEFCIFLTAIVLSQASLCWAEPLSQITVGHDRNADQAALHEMGMPKLLGSGSTAFAFNLNGPLASDDFFVTFNTDSPSSLTEIAVTSSSFVAGDFLDGDFSTLYAINFADEFLYAIDTMTGAQSAIGHMPPISGHNWSGMSVDPSTGIMYGASARNTVLCYDYTLYTIDVFTADTSIIGSAAGACIKGIAINTSGDMFGVEVVNDELVSINKITAGVTPIGDMGFNVSILAQGMDFDESTGVLYLATINIVGPIGLATNVPELRTANLNTGATTLVGEFGLFTEFHIASFAIAAVAPVPLQFYDLTVNTSGNGSVTSDPAGIYCGVDCGAVYAETTTVKLYAKPEPFYDFGLWNGACTTSTTQFCEIAMEQDQFATALFVPNADFIYSDSFEGTSTTPPPPPWINELHYDNMSTDTGEFVEIAGRAGTDLSNWTLIGYNGVDGFVYQTIPLGGTIPDESNSIGALSFGFLALQNGAPDGIALVNPVGQVIKFISYEGAFTAADGPAMGMTAVDILVSEDSTTAIGFSLQLGGNGSQSSDFSWQTPQAETPGMVNAGQSY